MMEGRRTKILRAESPEAFARHGAEIFVAACNGAIAARGSFAVALTGGSTPGPIHRLLASDPYRARVDWTHVHLFWGDERAVPPSVPESNYGAARDQLLAHVPLPVSHVHRIVAESADLVAAAVGYERALREACGGILDLIFVGIGKDGHILSLYPGSPAIDEERAWVVAEIDPPMNPPLSRITLTPPVLANARKVVALAAGGEKMDAVRAAIEGPDDPHRTPAQLLRRVRDLTWLLDAPAAAALSEAR